MGDVCRGKFLFAGLCLLYFLHHGMWREEFNNSGLQANCDQRFPSKRHY